MSDQPSDFEIVKFVSDMGEREQDRLWRMYGLILALNSGLFVLVGFFLEKGHYLVPCIVALFGTAMSLSSVLMMGMAKYDAARWQYDAKVLIEDNDFLRKAIRARARERKDENRSVRDFQWMGGLDRVAKDRAIHDFEVTWRPQWKGSPVLVISAGNDSEELTIAGFNDAGEFRTIVVDVSSHGLYEELKQGPEGLKQDSEMKKKVLLLASIELDRPFPPGNILATTLAKRLLIGVGFIWLAVLAYSASEFSPQLLGIFSDADRSDPRVYWIKP